MKFVFILMLSLLSAIDGQSNDANYLVKNPELLETIRILLVLMLIMTVTFLLALTYQTESSVFIRPEVYKPFFIFGVTFFWIVSLLVYFIKIQNYKFIDSFDYNINRLKDLLRSPFLKNFVN